MKIALDWIACYLDRPVAAAEAQEALINAGLVVEQVEPIGGTHVLDVEVTSNRTDCLSHRGLARELAALLGRHFQTPEITLRETRPDAGQFMAVRLTAPDGCPYYSARVIRGVKVGPSPEWLRRALANIGLRSVNNVVDVTNYVLMDTGQPLHAFDLEKLADHEIVVRRAVDNEKITTLDGRSHALDGEMLVIADARTPVAIAGIMGGRQSEVTEATRDILLEAAVFDPLNIRRTARRLGLASDSSFRFERGLDPAMVEDASRRATKLLLEVAGGTLAEGVLTAGQVTVRPVEVTVRLSRVAEIMGVDIPAAAMVDILGRLQLAPRLDRDRVTCMIPSFRSDLSREIDLIEEIGRLWGYNRIPAQPVVRHAVQPPDPAAQAQRAMRRTLAACGWQEAISFSFVDPQEAALFLEPAQGAVQVSDAVRKSVNFLRPSLWPGLLRARQLNQNHGENGVRLFEQAGVYWQNEADLPPAEESHVALIGNDVSEVLGAVEALLRTLHPAATLEASPCAKCSLAEGAAAKLEVRLPSSGNGAARTIPLGVAGRFSDAVMKFYDLRHDTAGAELRWDTLRELFQPVRLAVGLPRFPTVQRDLSVVLANAVRWADVRAALQSAKLPFLEEVRFVGTWRGGQIGADNKSCTFTLLFRDPHATLRSEQVDAQVHQAVELLKEKFQAVLR